MVNVVTTRKGAVVQERSIVTMLLNHPLAAWLWLPIRVWLGWQWLVAGWEKVINPAWLQTGVALKGFLGGAASAVSASGKPVIHYTWYSDFLKLLASAKRNHCLPTGFYCFIPAVDCVTSKMRTQ